MAYAPSPLAPSADAPAGAEVEEAVAFPLLRLDDDLLCFVLSFLSASDIARCALVCARFRALCQQDEKVWYPACQRRWGDVTSPRQWGSATWHESPTLGLHSGTFSDANGSSNLCSMMGKHRYLYALLDRWQSLIGCWRGVGESHVGSLILFEWKPNRIEGSRIVPARENSFAVVKVPFIQVSVEGVARLVCELITDWPARAELMIAKVAALSQCLKTDMDASWRRSTFNSTTEVSNGVTYSPQQGRGTGGLPEAYLNSPLPKGQHGGALDPHQKQSHNQGQKQVPIQNPVQNQIQNQTLNQNQIQRNEQRPGRFGMGPTSTNITAVTPPPQPSAQPGEPELAASRGVINDVTDGALLPAEIELCSSNHVSVRALWTNVKGGKTVVYQRLGAGLVSQTKSERDEPRSTTQEQESPGDSGSAMQGVVEGWSCQFVDSPPRLNLFNVSQSASTSVSVASDSVQDLYESVASRSEPSGRQRSARRQRKKDRAVVEQMAASGGIKGQVSASVAAAVSGQVEHFVRILRMEPWSKAERPLEGLWKGICQHKSLDFVLLSYDLPGIIRCRRVAQYRSPQRADVSGAPGSTSRYSHPGKAGAVRWTAKISSFRKVPLAQQDMELFLSRRRFQEVLWAGRPLSCSTLCLDSSTSGGTCHPSSLKSVGSGKANSLCNAASTTLLDPAADEAPEELDDLVGAYQSVPDSGEMGAWGVKPGRVWMYSNGTFGYSAGHTDFTIDYRLVWKDGQLLDDVTPCRS